MRVHLIDIDQRTGAETYRTTCPLSECFPEQGPIGDDFRDAMTYLRRHGRYRLGGGAAPLVLLLNASMHWAGYPS